MAVTNSVVPLLWMSGPAAAITQDDLLYALVMWKLLGLYADRPRHREDRPADPAVPVALRCRGLHRCACSPSCSRWTCSGCRGCSRDYYSIAQNVPGLQDGTGSSTAGPARRDRRSHDLQPGGRRRPVDPLRPAPAGAGGCRRALRPAACCPRASSPAPSAWSSASSASPRAAARRRLLTVFLPGAAIGAYVLRPVIGQRLSGFQSALRAPDRAGPGRLHNLETYFWPKLFSDWNFVLGVAPCAPGQRRHPGDRLCLDRERLHLAAVGRRHPAAGQLPLLRVCDGEEKLAGGARCP